MNKLGATLSRFSREGDMKKLTGWISTIGAVVALAVPTAASAEAIPETTNEFVPLEATIFDECLGEPVLVTGERHLVTHTTVDAQGVTHFVFHRQWVQVTAVGAVSGASYEIVSVFQHVDQLADDYEQHLNLNMRRRIGAGDTPNSLISAALLLRFDPATGEWTTVAENVKAECL